MTTFDTTRTASATRPTFGATLVNLFGAVRTWNDARVTRKALHRLTARELDDIGLCRGDIDAIANRGGRY